MTDDVEVDEVEVVERPADWEVGYPGDDLSVKIYRYVPIPEVGYDIAPVSYDYKTGLTRRLFDEPTIKEGLLVRMDWYADQEKTDLVLTVRCVYTFDALGQVKGRTCTRVWYRENGRAAEPVKITTKDYTSLQAHAASIRRRHNIITQIKIATVYLLAETTPPEPGMEQMHLANMAHTGTVFLSKIRPAIEDYVEDGNRMLAQVLMTEQDYWLDNPINADGVTIRQYMTSQLR